MSTPTTFCNPVVYQDMSVAVGFSCFIVSPLDNLCKPLYDDMLYKKRGFYGETGKKCE